MLVKFTYSYTVTQHDFHTWVHSRFKWGWCCPKFDVY